MVHTGIKITMELLFGNLARTVRVGGPQPEVVLQVVPPTPAAEATGVEVTMMVATGMDLQGPTTVQIIGMAHRTVTSGVGSGTKTSVGHLNNTTNGDKETACLVPGPKPGMVAAVAAEGAATVVGRMTINSGAVAPRKIMSGIVMVRVLGVAMAVALLEVERLKRAPGSTPIGNEEIATLMTGQI